MRSLAYLRLVSENLFIHLLLLELELVHLFVLAQLPSIQTCQKLGKRLFRCSAFDVLLRDVGVRFERWSKIIRVSLHLGLQFALAEHVKF